jgi:magnesium-transporting ATPase (P-type)
MVVIIGSSARVASTRFARRRECHLSEGGDEDCTTHASVNMTMAFAIVSFSAVNIGLVMRRERQAPWSSPVFPYLGWIILGWVLTWAAVELGMLQRLLDTTSLTGREWIIVLALSLLAPAAVALDKVIQLSRQRKALAAESLQGDARVAQGVVARAPEVVGASAAEGAPE